MGGLAAHRLLVIDDDELFLEIARFNLEKAGFDVEVTSDPRVGLNRAIESPFDLPVRWVFGIGPLSMQMRVMAWFVLLGFLGILVGLIGF
jgi:CheY-like chemotaxis protein